jgi:indole-3-glycerol phosphate synthase
MSILDNILKHKKAEVAARKEHMPLARLQSLAESAITDKEPGRFVSALRTERIAIIAEIKKASPSAGVLCDDFDPAEIARSYDRGGVAAISVLTDEKFFSGHLFHLRQVANEVKQPLLRKDFIIDAYQIYEAALYSASAVLLLAVALADEQLVEFILLASSLKLDALVEMHNQNELARVLNTPAEIIGINNRDLKMLKVSLATSLELVKSIPSDKIKISESGIKTREDVVLLEQAGFDAVLIGETLMRQKDRASFLHYLGGR